MNEAVGRSLEDFGSQFENLAQALNNGVISGEITTEQQCILRAVPKRLGSSISRDKIDTQMLLDQQNQTIESRLTETGRLMGKATSALLETPDKAVDKFLSGIFGSGRKSLTELIRIGAEQIAQLSATFEDFIRRLGSASADTIAEAIRKPENTATKIATNAVSEVQNKTGEGTGKLIEENKTNAS